MKILGVDQSYTSSGLVINKDSEVLHAEVYSTPKGVDIFLRAWSIAHHISTVASDHNVDSVNIEGLAFGMRGDATRDLAGLQFLIVSQLKFVNKLDVKIISPKSLKKFATDNGKAKKIDMFEAVPVNIQTLFLEHYQFKKTKGLYDVTDAYWLSMYKEE